MLVSFQKDPHVLNAAGRQSISYTSVGLIYSVCLNQKALCKANISNKIGWIVYSGTCSFRLSKLLDVAIFEQHLHCKICLFYSYAPVKHPQQWWPSKRILPYLVTFSALSSLFSISSYTRYCILHDSLSGFPFMKYPSACSSNFFLISFSNKFAKL